MWVSRKGGVNRLAAALNLTYFQLENKKTKFLLHVRENEITEAVSSDDRLELRGKSVLSEKCREISALIIINFFELFQGIFCLEEACCLRANKSIHISPFCFELFVLMISPLIIQFIQLSRSVIKKLDEIL